MTRDNLTGKYTGVVDRIVDGETAVILVESEGEVIDQVDISADKLPEPAAEDRGMVTLELSGGTVVAIVYEEEETDVRREAIEEKLDRLSRRLGSEGL